MPAALWKFELDKPKEKPLTVFLAHEEVTPLISHQRLIAVFGILCR